MKNLQVTLILVLLGVLPVALTGCTKSRTEKGKMVYYDSHVDDVKSWDPANAYDSISLDVVPSVYESLYQYEYLSEEYHLAPLLAADMPKFSKDRKTITIRLRRDIRFQDDPCFQKTGGKGRAVMAHDFVYGFKRLALPSINSAGWWILDGKVKGANAFREKTSKDWPKSLKDQVARTFVERFEGVQALDDYTLQIKLVKPYPQLLYSLAMAFTAPVPYEAVEMYGDEQGNITDHPVGTGPYILKTWQRGRQIVLERNPNFHVEFYPTTGSAKFRNSGLLEDAGKRLPFVDRIEISVIREGQPRWLRFLKGQLDRILLPKDNFTQAISGRQLSPALAAKGIRLHVETGSTAYWVAFNMKDKLVGGNKYLRQALSASINREKYIEIFTNGTGQKMTTALPPGLQDRPKNSKLKYDFNLEKAKQLLKKAGYPNGHGLPELKFDLNGASSVSRQLGEFFTQQFAEIGVKTNFITNNFPAYLEKTNTGNLQVFYGGWQLDYPDAENVYQLLYGPNRAPGPNSWNYERPEMNRLFEQMAVLTPGAQRAALISKMDDLLQEDTPWALLYYHATYELTQPWLRNYRSNDIVLNRYKYLKIEDR